MIKSTDIEEIFQSTKQLGKLAAKVGFFSKQDYYNQLKAFISKVEGFFANGDTCFYLSSIEQLAPVLRACHVQIVKGLLFCGRYSEALNEVRSAVMSHGIDCFERPLLLRLFLNSNIEGNVALLDGEKCVSWVSDYIETGEDRCRPVTVLDFQVERSGEQPILLFTVRCPCCNQVLRVDFAKDFASGESFVCWHCYAGLRFEKEGVYAVGRNYFLTFLSLQPREENRLVVSAEALSNIVQMAALLMPLIHIRFGKLRTERVGHQLMNSIYYYSNVRIDGSAGVLDVLGEVFDNGKPLVANRALQDLINSALEKDGVVIDPVGTQIGSGLSQANRHNITKYTFDLSGYPNVLNPQKTIPIKFSEDQTSFCRQKILEMGIPRDASYVCLHVRSSHYLREQFNDTGNAFAYHDYRDSDVNDYVSAVRVLNKNGIYVLRMGAATGLPDLNYQSPLYIDYARDFRSEIMDVYLSLNCKFMLSSGSGIDMLPWYYQVPLLIVNVHPVSFAMPENPWLLLIAKKLRSKKLGRCLSLKEQYELGGGYYRSQHIAARGFEIVNNTPDEIATATREMLLLLKNEWFPSPEYLRKHERLRLVSQYVSLLHTKRAALPRIGQDFLLQNTWDL
jgi:putative glycosyltransferase (TIGR04372 family)